MTNRIYHQSGSVTLHIGDALEVLSTMPTSSVHCVVTSPPYWGLRDYKVGDQQYGLEATPDAYVDRLRAVFDQLRRIVVDTGTVWLNLGDCYSAGRPGHSANALRASTLSGRASAARLRELVRQAGVDRTRALPPKNLLGMPWRVAFALQHDGWILRNGIFSAPVKQARLVWRAIRLRDARPLAGAGRDNGGMADWLALSVALVAALISAWSVWVSLESKRIARSARDVSQRALEIEQERRHDELRPRLRAEWKREQMGEAVWFYNDSSRSYSDVIVRVRVEPPPFGPRNPEHDGPVWFLNLKDEIAELSSRLGPLPTSDRRRVEMVRSGWPSGGRPTEMVFEAVCRTDDGHQWTVDVPCDVPPWETELAKLYRERFEFGLEGLIP